MRTRKINLIVIHCSDSDVKSHDDINVIRNWHLARGFADVGYHYFIKKDGEVQKGRDEEIVGAHVDGHNANSIGICLSGKRIFTDEQMKSAIRLCNEICKRHKLRKFDIVGHNELNCEKTCPNFEVSDEIARFVD